jgi:hypothetical protein
MMEPEVVGVQYCSLSEAGADFFVQADSTLRQRTWHGCRGPARRSTDLALPLKSGLGEAEALHGKFLGRSLCLPDRNGCQFQQFQRRGSKGLRWIPGGTSLKKAKARPQGRAELQISVRLAMRV